MPAVLVPPYLSLRVCEHGEVVLTKILGVDLAAVGVLTD